MYYSNAGCKRHELEINELVLWVHVYDTLDRIKFGLMIRLCIIINLIQPAA